MLPVIICGLFYSINVQQPFHFQWLQIIRFTSIIYFYFMISVVMSDDLSSLTISKQKTLFGFLLQISIYIIIFILNYFLVAKVKFDIHYPAAIIKSLIKNYFFTERGIELNLIIAVVLMIVSVVSFNKRKSFL